MISVIVPTMSSRRHFLERYCLPSIQCCVDEIEVIVVEGDDENGPRKRNRGASEAKGEFLFFCDDDTILGVDCLDKLREGIGSYAFAYCDFHASPMYPHRGRACRHKAGPFDPKKLERGSYISTMSLIARDWFLGFDEDLHRGQDWELFLSITELGGEGIYVPGYLFLAICLDGGTRQSGSWHSARRQILRKHRLPV